MLNFNGTFEEFGFVVDLKSSKKLWWMGIVRWCVNNLVNYNNNYLLITLLPI